MATLPFVKMHGLGNDFVVIDDLPGRDSRLTPALATRLCDRRFGIGADQVLWLRKPEARDAAQVRMEILNADGSTAEMCGNGIRAVALYLHDHGPQPGLREYRVETLAGIKTLRLHGREVAVDMGAPGLGKGMEGPRPESEPVSVGSREFRFFEVSMGNPHAVIFVDGLGVADVAAVPLEDWGPKLETHPRFPKKTNVEFVEVTGPSSIRVRVWERGSGVTLACGTGACAAAVATLGLKKARGPLTVSLPGGSLRIGWDGPGNPVIMEGPATEVFRGEFRLD
jgi:diaminopimelate epimerase